MMAHEIGVTAVEACIPVVGRWSDAEGLLSQRIRVLVFKLESESFREAPERAKLDLVRNGIPAGLIDADWSERLEWTARLNLSRCRRRIIDVEQPLESSALVTNVGNSQRRVVQHFTFNSEVP